MNDLLAKKVVQAVQPLQVHNVDELPSVFRHIQSGKSVGKMVIRRSLSEGKDVAVCVPLPLPSTLRWSITSNSSLRFARLSTP